MFMTSISKFFGILMFQAMLIVAKRIVNAVLNAITGVQKKHKNTFDRYGFV